MIDEWELANSEFLTGAVAWLRARLESYIAELHGAEPSGSEEPVAHAVDSSADRAHRATARKPHRTRANPASLPRHVPIDSALDPPPALAILGRRFGLTAFELDVLLLCVGFELDTRIAGLCARAHDDPSRSYPTLALALMVFDDAAWDVTSLERPLRRWQFVNVERRAALPLTLSPLQSDARTVDFVKGFNRIDERLTTLVGPLERADEALLPASQRTIIDRIVAVGVKGTASGPLTTQFVGPDAASKLRISAAVAEKLSRNAWRLEAAWLPTSPVDVDEIARLWQRESFLAPTLLVLDAHEVNDDRESDVSRAVRRFVSRGVGDVVLSTRSAWAGLDEPSLTLDVQLPTALEQLAFWNRLLIGTPATGFAPQLAAQFRLDFPAIERIAEAALAGGGETPLAERLWDECCLNLQPRLQTLAQHIDARANWDDIILPSEQDAQLHEIAAHVRGRFMVYEDWGFAETTSRGLGISALFAGDSGTGKTMAAEVLANDLRLPLYRIDLSAVVSKYIGETERNLRLLFDAADSGGFILFFDEADALFGKRSEVHDSHDRYANIEINYLLQRIEAYRGLAILATNARAALDTAFVRRLRFIVTFAHPSIAERRRMWEKAFPAKTPVHALDFDRLARLHATGGIIRNAALGAAFAATAGGHVITMPLILAALKSEYRKLNRPIDEAAFGVSETATRASRDVVTT